MTRQSDGELELILTSGLILPPAVTVAETENTAFLEAEEALVVFLSDFMSMEFIVVSATAVSETESSIIDENLFKPEVVALMSVNVAVVDAPVVMLVLNPEPEYVADSAQLPLTLSVTEVRLAVPESGLFMVAWQLKFSLTATLTVPVWPEQLTAVTCNAPRAATELITAAMTAKTAMNSFLLVSISSSTFFLG